MSPQCDRLLGLLRAREAGAGSRCAARVADLPADGFDVRTEWQAVPTRFGKTARVARYRLVERTAPYRGWQPQMFSSDAQEGARVGDASPRSSLAGSLPAGTAAPGARPG